MKKCFKKKFAHKFWKACEKIEKGLLPESGETDYVCSNVFKIAWELFD